MLKKLVVYLFMSFRQSEGKKSATIGPDKISRSVHNFRITNMS